MEFILDTINLDEIRDGVDHMPISGITSNPSIVKKTAPDDFFEHMREVRRIIGKERSLHIQVVGGLAAKRIFEEVDEDVYIKIPTSYEGVKAIKALKAQGRNVTATAIYTVMQAYMALEAGADYIAPYVNRIANIGGDPYDLIDRVESRIAMDGYDCKILAASFHALGQVEESLAAGAQAITAPYGVLKTIFGNINISQAIKDFNNDWYDLYGDNKKLSGL